MEKLKMVVLLGWIGVVFSCRDTSQLTASAQADKITNLPGAEKLDVNFNQFSGYLQIKGSSGAKTKNIHYWLVESMSDPIADPITFWTNGGPGCSGLIGFMTEQGPFRPNEDGSLKLNEFAWNKISNMIYIEAPCGVGFSYSDDSNDLKTGDTQTALDNYNLIQEFLVRFPDYKTNALYISSESYGGHYMPTLAKRIVDENAAGDQPYLNFKGFAVGNPYTNVYSGTPAEIDTYWGHQVIPKPDYDAYRSACDASPSSLACLRTESAIFADVGNLNPYALDYPVCLTSSLSRIGRAQRTWLRHHQLSGRGLGAADKKKYFPSLAPTDEYEPCADNYGSTYLNSAAVKEAIHVKTSIKWGECSNTVRYNTSDGQIDMSPIYKYLIDGGFGLNILVYSGDDDAVCGTVGTQDWIWSLGYELKRPFWQTYLVKGQTAGFLSKWTNTKLAFLTVHTAGHEVPTYVPEVALDLYQKYLSGDFTNA